MAEHFVKFGANHYVQSISSSLLKVSLTCDGMNSPYAYDSLVIEIKC